VKGSHYPFGETTKKSCERGREPWAEKQGSSIFTKREGKKEGEDECQGKEPGRRGCLLKDSEKGCGEISPPGGRKTTTRKVSGLGGGNGHLPGDDGGPILKGRD